ncbi:MAG: multicopper oxidase domain-containing protein [Casimicrobiaceae bacterium]
MAPAPRPPSARGEFSNPLRLPGVAGLFALVKAAQPIRLEARSRRLAIFPGGRTTNLMVYQATIAAREVMNPLLTCRSGETFDVTLANRLGEDTTIHWHGLSIDERNDGSGMNPVKADQDYLYRFPIRNRAGLYWYHPHPHDRTGAQVQLGLGGLLLVSDDEDDALRRELGLTLGDTEIPLVIQDKSVDDMSRIKYSMGEDDWIGNRVLVNLTPEPRFEAKTCLHRFRILNGSNARTYLLAFTQGGVKLPYTLIGTDGGLLAEPQPVTEIYLAPAQRVDVLVDFEKLVAGSTVMMTSLRYDPMENDGGAAGVDPMLEHPGAPPLGDPIDLMRIDLKVPVCAPRKIPARLSSMPPVPKANGKTRKFRLHLDGTRWLINGANYHDDMRAMHVRVKRGSKELWDIRNDMKSMPHPMHLHAFQFRVVSRYGSPAQLRRLAITPAGLTAQDLGWMDTVLVWPGETVRIALDFSQPYTATQRYMFHCHNLEHEDQGMMLNFAVER